MLKLTVERTGWRRLSDSSGHTSNHWPPPFRALGYPASIPISPQHQICIGFDGRCWAFFGKQGERGRKREKSHALFDAHLLRQSKVINSQTGDCKLNYLDGEPGCGRDQRRELVSHLSISKAFRAGGRSCERLNSREGSAMIKANLHIAGQPYKSTVWNWHLRWWLIFQAPGFGPSTCIFGPFRSQVEWSFDDYWSFLDQCFGWKMCGWIFLCKSDAPFSLPWLKCFVFLCTTTNIRFLWLDLVSWMLIKGLTITYNDMDIDCIGLVRENAWSKPTQVCPETLNIIIMFVLDVHQIYEGYDHLPLL